MLYRKKAKRRQHTDGTHCQWSQTIYLWSRWTLLSCRTESLQLNGLTLQKSVSNLEQTLKIHSLNPKGICRILKFWKYNFLHLATFLRMFQCPLLFGALCFPGDQLWIPRCIHGMVWTWASVAFFHLEQSCPISLTQCV